MLQPGARIVVVMNTTARILVVEDDPCAMLLLGRILEQQPAYDCTFTRSSDDAARLLAEQRWDLLITDLHLPGLGGLELADLGRDRDPVLPVLVITAQPTIDAAVRAVRTSVTDFLVKPLGSEQVLAACDRALAQRRLGAQVLAVGAHPDDIEIGAGAALAGHVARGDQVTIVTLSRGRVGGDAEQRAAEAEEAARRLGARLVLGDLEDTRIPANGATIELIEQVVREVDPDVVYTHSAHDLHQDHRAVHEATLVAARGVRKVLAYQSPSATIEFRPSMFVPVEQLLPRKLGAIAAFESQTSIRDYLEEDMLTATARYWGRFGKTRYAEAFEVIRDAQEVARVSA